MSSKKVNEKSQATKKMVRITLEVKKEIVEKYERVMRIRDLAAACRMPRTTVSTIVKNKDVIKPANVAKGVKLITKQRSGKSLDRFVVNVKPGDPQPGPSREKGQKRENYSLLNFYLFHLIAFVFMYFSIKQCLNYFIQPHQCIICQ
jgi:hypothetical protein